MHWSSLHHVSPYEGFDPVPYQLDLQGWNSFSPVFGELVEAVRPKLIVEVGTWKGASAIHMADLCRDRGLDTKIVCIDTWLGAVEFWFAKEDDKERSLQRCCGYPQVYYQFLANVMKSGHQDAIIPLPNTSRIGSSILKSLGVKADLIYIDGSHEYLDVLNDLNDCHGLLAPNGVMFGDDYAPHWADVQNAVQKFSADENIPFEEKLYFWIMRK